MAKYAAKRIALALVTLLVVSFATFYLMNLVPGGPFLSEKSPSASVLKALEEKYGLDKPVGEQYINYMKNLVKGDLGPSMKQRGKTVSGIISTRFPVSAKIGGLSVLVAVLLGVPLGAIAALNRGKWLDKLIIVIATMGISVPSFVVCTVLMYFFSLQLGWLPSIFSMTNGLTMIMPVMALAFYPTAYISRLTRSSMLDVLGQDYMRTARAKGVSGFKMLFKHALRNAVLPVVTYLGPMIAFTLTGSLVVEQIFTIPGLGSSFISAITGRDYMLIMGTTMFLAALLITMNVIVDVAYKIIDPRIKLN